jgi:hypothetical protein
MTPTQLQQGIKFQCDQLTWAIDSQGPSEICGILDEIDSLVAEFRKAISPLNKYEAFKDLWNQAAREHGLPEILKLTDGRKDRLKTRLKDPEWAGNFASALKLIPKSPFLMGKNGWKANFDWLLQKDSVIRVVEGCYVEAVSSTNPQHLQSAIRALEEEIRLHPENRDGPNHRTGASTLEGRQELAGLRQRMSEERSRLNNIRTP